MVTASGSLDRAARHRARRGQGHAVLRVPRRAGRPAASGATGSSRARTRLVFAWAGYGARPGRRVQRCPDRAARGNGRRDGSGVPEASRSRPAPGPVAARGRCGRVKTVLTRNARCPRRGRRPLRPVRDRLQTTRRRAAAEARTPRRCSPRRSRTSTTPAGSTSPRHRRPPRRRDRSGQRRRHRHHAPAFDGTITVSPVGPGFEVPVVGGRRRGSLRPAPAHDGLHAHRPRTVRPRTRPGLMSPDAGFSTLLSETTDKSRRGGGGRGASAAVTTTPRCSPSTPAPCPATSSRTSSHGLGRLRRVVHHHRRRRAPQAGSPACSTRTDDDDDLHR